MSNILHNITYTVRSSSEDILLEQQTSLTRNHTLTTKGVERILRKAGTPVVSVDRVETFIDER